MFALFAMLRAVHDRCLVTLERYPECAESDAGAICLIFF